MGIIKKATTEILKGKSHQEIFNEIVSQTNLDIHKVAETIRRIPSLEKRKEYKVLNIIFTIGFGIVLLAGIYYSLFYQTTIAFIIQAAISIALVYGLLTYKTYMHPVAGLYSFAGTIFLIVNMLTSQDFIYAAPIVYTLSLMVIAFYLNSKLLVDYTFNKELLKSNPQQRVDIVTFTN